MKRKKLVIPLLLTAAVLAVMILYSVATGNITITDAVIEPYTDPEGTADETTVNIVVSFSAPADAGQLTWLLTADNEDDTILYVDQIENDTSGTYRFPVLLESIESAFGTEDIDGKTLILRAGCSGSSEAAYREITFKTPYEKILYGDANGDGSVTNRDAARILQYLAKWPVTINEKAADANGDGNVTNRDASRILQYLAKWPVELGK